jgi:hypothetical protein
MDASSPAPTVTLTDATIATLDAAPDATATATATTAPPEEPSIGELAGKGVDAAKQGQWMIVMAIFVLLAVTALKKWGAKVWPKLGTGPGAFWSAIVLGVAGAMGISISDGTLANDGAVIVSTILSGAVAGLSAAGLYSGVKTTKKAVIGRAGTQPPVN